MSLRTLPGRNRWRSMSGPQKIAFAAVGTVATAAIAGGGVFATWSSTQSLTSGSYAAGQQNINFASTGNPEFSVGLTDMIPGDYTTRYANVSNTGTVVEDVDLEIEATADGNSKNDWSKDSNLKVTVWKCAIAWVSGQCSSGTGTPIVGTGAAVLPDTGVSVSTVVASQRVVGDLAATKGVSYLKVVIGLDTAAPKSSELHAGSVKFTVTGTTNTGTERNPSS